jgi:YHS domain-containing protein
MTKGEKSHTRCVVCGKAIINEQRKEKAEIINGTSYTFDSNECVLMFKKFRAVYGSDFI